MKKLNNLLTILLAVVAIFSFNACTDDDAFTFVAATPSDAITFENATASVYLLSAQTAGNNAERLVWNSPDFDVETTISYMVEGSISDTFATIDFASNTLSETNFAIKVKDLMDLGALLGLDADPSTIASDGSANNEGQVYFRVIATVGTGATSSPNVISETAILPISFIEDTGNASTGIEIATWGVVGSAANDWGNAGPDLPFYTTATDGVFVAYVNLKDGEIKFRENNDWANNFGDTGADGTLDAGGDNLVVTAGDYKIVINFNDNTYTIEAYSFGIVGSAWNDWGAAGPDAKFFYDYTTDTFKVGVKLLDGAMKIRFNNDWALNYGDTGADGTLDEGGDDIVVTAGFYLITINLNDLTYTAEAANLYGVVGSGYNDWGATPDATFTEINPGIWKAENVTLIDGEIKFRVNEDWAVNFGDTGADGTLDDGGDNIAVTAGTYDIFLDFNDSTYTLITK